MKKKTKDYLKFIGSEIYQDDEMFCSNSDTVLLGMFLDFKSNLDILDIGTNNGSLLLYANRLKPKSLCGIDILKRAIDLANENMKMNQIDNYELYNISLQEFEHDSFDIIICNPPFFKERNVRDNKYKQIAMFEDNLSLEELFKNSKRLLKENGSIYMIYPANRLVEFYELCKKEKLKIMLLKMVYDTKKNEASRFIVKMKKGPMTKTKILKPYYIHDGMVELDIFNDYHLTSKHTK